MFKYLVVAVFASMFSFAALAGDKSETPAKEETKTETKDSSKKE